MDTEDLELFLSLYESGSVQQTARGFFASASTVSRRLRSFEDELGVQLFTRSPAGLQPTRRADTLLPYAQRILSDTATMAASLRSEASGARPVQVAATIGLAQFVLAPVVRSVLQNDDGRVAGGVSIDMRSSDDVVQAVAAGKADLGLTFAGGSASGLREEFVATTSNIAVVDESHPLASVEMVSFADIAEYPIAVERQGNTSRLMLDRAFASLGRPLMPFVECACPATIRRIVRGTECVAVFAERLLSQGEFTDGFAYLQLDDPAVQDRRIRAITRGGVARTDALEALVAGLRARLSL
ncbi:LysR family transcriptional regulator [Brevibacterium luteolum]|uniref:LysR family transcriptional regulator n=1 Tax=Brevibacterium luteolum TaxID=199591 RepID=UPI001C23450D|nr:LysR family transcriptional regulator [Brevibacterium luteolum]